MPFINKLGGAAPSRVAVGGQIWTFGRSNANGAMMDGTTSNRSSPAQVGSLTDWLYCASGDEEMFCVKTDKSMWHAGRATYGVNGLGNLTAYSSPVQVGSLLKWTSVASSGAAHAAVDDAGKLWTWGRNQVGQMGRGNTTNYSSPVQVGALTDWYQLTGSITGAHFHAIKTDGTLWAWGYNATDGALGDGTTTNRSSPVQIGARTNYIGVWGGTRHCIAITSDGKAWSWGLGGSGNLGHNNNSSLSSPVQIGVATNWTHAACGGIAHAPQSFLINSNGELFTMGSGAYGANWLGNETVYSVPTQVGSLTTWESMLMNSQSMLARKTDGTVWNAGYKWGTALNRSTNNSSPIQVGVFTDTVSYIAGAGFSMTRFANFIIRTG